MKSNVLGELATIVTEELQPAGEGSIEIRDIVREISVIFDQNLNSYQTRMVSFLDHYRAVNNRLSEINQINAILNKNEDKFAESQISELHDTIIKIFEDAKEVQNSGLTFQRYHEVFIKPWESKIDQLSHIEQANIAQALQLQKVKIAELLGIKQDNIAKLLQAGTNHIENIVGLIISFNEPRITIDGVVTPELNLPRVQVIQNPNELNSNLK